ncbi:hypothetical protein PVC01_090043200 [Plasmodium vivax]|uniref:(malaria parasite P. vivax) hypothetical protein n=1 Tax=Plasmodium vivax TaxID=5855 RepID=A0A1G4GY46_PLAVI|nr:unnamed protein product [Plasmodium vivax]CAI7720684.1 hypothetical protein PVPAM_090044900 [Plasmodium vivax]SCO67496.1 hypothetical protein PVT01_090043800 [Plasmodium vivax]SCO72883.1 hypothetical protein PVC01_090043200 [Plasmodium vivax]
MRRVLFIICVLYLCGDDRAFVSGKPRRLAEAASGTPHDVVSSLMFRRMSGRWRRGEKLQNSSWGNGSTSENARRAAKTLPKEQYQLFSKLDNMERETFKREESTSNSWAEI